MYYSIQLQNIVWFLLAGVFVGGLASILVRGRGMGLLADITVGVVGALLGGLLTDSLYWDVLGLGGVLGFSAFSALILIFLFRGLFGKEQTG